jgi:hypothetical protein
MKLNKDVIYIAIILVAILISSFFSIMRERKNIELQNKLNENEAIIQSYRNVIELHKNNIDSIQILRHENDNTIFNLSSDSLESIFTIRFGNDSTQNSE